MSYVVAVDFDDVPVECFIFGAEWFEWHDVFCVAVDLDVVSVDDEAEVVECLFAGEHYCFPVVSFVVFSVAGYAVDADVFVVYACCDCCAYCLAES